jgi:hypothetical protein
MIGGQNWTGDCPIFLAEASECCGQLHSNDVALEQCGTTFAPVCPDCPLLKSLAGGVCRSNRERA